MEYDHPRILLGTRPVFLPVKWADVTTTTTKTAWAVCSSMDSLRTTPNGGNLSILPADTHRGTAIPWTLLRACPELAEGTGLAVLNTGWKPVPRFGDSPAKHVQPAHPACWLNFLSHKGTRAQI
jgi:hypothetical protein